MKFERNLDIKDAVGIGLKANAPMINYFYIEMVDSVSFESGMIRKSLQSVDYTDVPRILSDIEHGRLFPEKYHFEVDCFSEDFKLQHLEDFKGKFIKCLINHQDRLRSTDTDIDEPDEMTFFIPT